MIKKNVPLDYGTHDINWEDLSDIPWKINF